LSANLLYCLSNDQTGFRLTCRNSTGCAPGDSVGGSLPLPATAFGVWLYNVAIWGWAGVILFFLMSGFLITSILLATRDKPDYFHTFHARRALRIWPLYVLLLVVVYLNAPWFIGPVWEAVKTAPWLAYIFFVQNLFHLTLPPAIGRRGVGD